MSEPPKPPENMTDEEFIKHLREKDREWARKIKGATSLEYPPPFAIGERVICVDNLAPNDPPVLGTVVGYDVRPPAKLKRSGPCLVVRPDNGEDWLVRECDEVKRQ